MDDFEKLLAKTLRYLSFRPRSQKEITDYLKKKNAEQKLQERVLSYLHDNKLIDDKEFASWWVDQRTRLTPRSKRIIAIELAQKGIDREIIEKAFVTEDEEPVDDLESAKRLLRKRIHRYKGLPQKIVYEK